MSPTLYLYKRTRFASGRSFVLAAIQVMPR